MMHYERNFPCTFKKGHVWHLWYWNLGTHIVARMKACLFWKGWAGTFQRNNQFTIIFNSLLKVIQHNNLKQLYQRNDIFSININKKGPHINNSDAASSKIYKQIPKNKEKDPVPSPATHINTHELQFCTHVIHISYTRTIRQSPQNHTPDGQILDANGTMASTQIQLKTR